MTTMSQSATPTSYTLDTTSTITDLLISRMEHAPHAHLLSILRGTREVEVSASQFVSEVRSVAKGLIARGVRPGQRVGILGATSYEWTLADYALWFTGAISVPFYDSSSEDQIAWMLENADIRSAFAAGSEQATRIRAASARAGREVTVFEWSKKHLDELIADGRGVSDAQLEAARASVKQSDTATLIYTSGTTGRPKACVLTHANFVLTVEAALNQLPEVLYPGGRCLLFLPTAHVFARFIEVACLSSGTILAHEGDLTKLTSALGLFRPTCLLGVPRVFEKVFNSAAAKAQGEGKGKIFAKAADVAVRFAEARGQGSVPLGLKLQHAVFDKLVYAKLRSVLGGRTAHAISGGGPLGTYLGNFFAGVGVEVLEGYGLTETTAPITVNVAGRGRIGTVGVPLPGNAVAIAPDGEVLCKGNSVFAGYLDNEEATNEAFRDGWFHSGDLGSLDSEGYLSITGRKKEMIVTSGGKNVAPAPLEDVLRRNALIAQAVVIGDNRKFISALIFLDEEMLPSWLKNHGLPAMDLQAASADATVRQEIEKEIATANKSVSRAEGIRDFRIVPAVLSEQSGDLSAKQSVKRHVVNEKLAEQIEDIYSQPAPGSRQA